MKSSTHNATATGFILDAIEFLRAGELLLNRSEGVSLPALFLLSRAIELSLKAFLLHLGVSGKKLSSREFGHNLAALLDAANQRGLATSVQLEQLEGGALDLLSQEYFCRRLGYRDTDGAYQVPRINLAESAARKLINGIHSIIDGKWIQ